MRCALSEKHVRTISLNVGITYHSMYARGGNGSNLLAWRDERNADTILRGHRKRLLFVIPEIRDGRSVPDAQPIWPPGAYIPTLPEPRALWTFTVQDGRKWKVITARDSHRLPWRFAPTSEYQRELVS
jgi:hypothetical protein